MNNVFPWLTLYITGTRAYSRMVYSQTCKIWIEYRIFFFAPRIQHVGCSPPPPPSPLQDSFASKLNCGSQSSFYCPPPLVKPTLLQYYCTTIAQYTRSYLHPLCMPYTIPYWWWQDRVKANPPLRVANKGDRHHRDQVIFVLRRPRWPCTQIIFYCWARLIAERAFEVLRLELLFELPAYPCSPPPPPPASLTKGGRHSRDQVLFVLRRRAPFVFNYE